MVKTEDQIWNALKWPEPQPAHTRKTDYNKTEYRDMFLRKADYWEKVRHDKENAKLENV